MLVVEPYVWEGRIEAYAKTVIAQNLWKFQAAGYEFTDLLHEACLQYCYCRDRYGTSVEPEHFVHLFARALHDRFKDLADISFKEKAAVIQSEFLEDVGGVCVNGGHFAVLVSEAPKEVKEVLALLFTIPSELVKSYGFNQKHKKGITTNTALCLLLGYNPSKINLVKEVKKYFNESSVS